MGVRGLELGCGGSWKIWGVSLTCTHSYCVPRPVPTVIAVETPVWVTDGSLCTVVPELLGTYLTALTAICDKAHTQRAVRWGLRTLTWPLAEFRAGSGVLQWHWSESHGCGGWRDDLWRKGRDENGLLSPGFPRLNGCNCLPAFIVFRMISQVNFHTINRQTSISFNEASKIRKLKVQRSQNSAQPVKFWHLISTLAHLGFLLSLDSQ